MAGIIVKKIERPPKDIVAQFKQMPTTIVSDVLNRMNAMHAAIKPLHSGVRMAGPAVTVKCMVGDNIMTHHAIYLAEEGDVLVIDGRGHVETSIWGGIQTLACRMRKLEGVVVDGSVRDVAELRAWDYPVFARGATPAGPHKGWGGSINEPIQCGGVSVSPGDIIVGDDDGVVVIPQLQASDVLARALKRMREESDWIHRVQQGEALVEILGFDQKLKQLGVEYR